MARKRNKENQGLPTRWATIGEVYYYQVPPGLEHFWDGKKKFRLGTQLNEAYAIWSARIQKESEVAEGDDLLQNIKTIGQLLDYYAVKVIPTKAPASQGSNQNQLPWLKKAFGDMPLLPFPPMLVYQYVTKRSVKKKNPETGRVTGGRIAAHREIELLSHAYTKAVEWGLIDRHPFKDQVRLTGEASRDRYIEDWEIIEALSLSSRRKAGSVLMIQAYIRLKLLTGMSQGDLLRLQESQLKEDGIHIQRHKTAGSTGKRTVYKWSDSLHVAIDMSKKARTMNRSQFLFCNKRGECYINETTGKASGWKSMWQRFMDRVIAETKVEEHFTEHDLRAKVASDADSLEHARALLAHADSRTTDRIYRRKAEIVQPLK